jgi:hypothetical protein
VALTDNECDGTTDRALQVLGVPAALLNDRSGRSAGNGFDDDCDGLVDEGCACPGTGTTKECYLVPATQADPATARPVGYCTENSKGTVVCEGSEFHKWGGACRGAQPAYRSDVCAPGDFNCDGVDANSDVEDCTCKVNPVTCPTAAITRAPFPDPNQLPVLDAREWITDPSKRALTTNWKWTVVGGDCDNVLPNPTFAIYNSPSASAAARRGAKQGVVFDTQASPPQYRTQAGAPLQSIVADNFGSGEAGAQVYPAFGLSGDYVVQGEFELEGTRYVCTQKVEVRAPGIRAELCWDSVGPGSDVDLHFARLQGVDGCSTKGWMDRCVQGSGATASYGDCYYLPSSGCAPSSSRGPNWGYADSPSNACHGWSSKRSSGSPCTNPRLDIDLRSCNRSVEDPTASNFCSPENINLDNPNDGDRFVVGVNYFAASLVSGGPARPHVNVYCNGARVLSAGYNPETGAQYPVLRDTGAGSSSDFWTVGIVRAEVVGGTLAACNVETVPSHFADPTRDGPPQQGQEGNGICVETHTSNSAPANKFRYSTHTFVENGPLQPSTSGMPNDAAAFCKH